MKEKLRSFLEDLSAREKARRLLLIAALAGIVLLAFSSLSGKESGEEEPPEPDVSQEDYETQLREKIETMVCAITGEEEALATFTFERAFEAVYAADQKREANERSYIVLRRSDGSQELGEVTKLSPQVRGVTVVCEKGGEPVFRARIIEAVSTALGISSHKVCVLEYHDGA